MKIWTKRILLFLICVGVAGCLAVVWLSAYVKSETAARILSTEEAAKQDVDCILVLGCGVRPDGTPSLMLTDRLDTGIALYRAGAAEKLLMSGDHGTEDYDEVNTMKNIYRVFQRRKESGKNKEKTYVIQTFDKRAIDRCKELFPIDVLSFKGKEFKRGMQIRITTIQQNVIIGEFIGLNRVNLVCIKTGNKIIAHQLEKIAEVTKAE